MLLMKDIIREGHPTLRQKAEPVSLPLSQDDLLLAQKMLEFLHNSQNEEIAEKYQLRAGVGLAAPQINVSKRIIALLVPGEYEDDPFILNTVMINPRIIKHSVQKACLTSGEGCLSVDREVPGYVPRFAKITVEYHTIDGNLTTVTLRDFPAIVVQHEIDHLNGVMFYDHINTANPFYKDEHLKIIE
ncbi:MULTISPECIES: peptide deformylase [unclassified Granulicatella]|uniref:peptide deformylase n=1 Tax=unclassified Granulicatella TaxID=2630493 RepID=UPI001074091C|nr:MULTISPECIES: peptide deformylase [unclassified Granulicatella]MBF0780904.1 peptide deformylase [Granulicatella sp. 19428wC4_WM01]TFU93233.1 peptide deformylase [Granulicatella sp. WM01]